MSKLTKREKENIILQSGYVAERGSTWVGFRPSVMKSPKEYSKSNRRDSKISCRDAVNSYNQNR